MNLYELAHHPDAFTALNNSDSGFWWGDSSNSTGEQFRDYLNNPDAFPNGYQEYWTLNHWAKTDENEFRMHLLFVYFATTPESEWI